MPDKTNGGRAEGFPALTAPFGLEALMELNRPALAAMARGLGERPWCNGGHFSLADIAVGCALGWLEFRYPDIDWRTSHPNLGRLLEKLAQRTSFADTVPVAG